MDIKLKNIKYALATKIIAVIIIWLSIMSGVGSGVFLLFNHDNLNDQSYYDTYTYKETFSGLVNYALELNVKLKSPDSIKASGAAPDVINSNLQQYYALKDRLAKTVNFAYYIKNTQTGETLTNVTTGDALALIKQQPGMIYYNQWTSAADYPPGINVHVQPHGIAYPGNSATDYPFGANQMLANTPYEIYAAVLTPLKAGDVFYNDYQSYLKVKTMAEDATILLIASVIMTLLASGYLVCAAGRREAGGAIVLLSVDRLYTDVHSLLVFIAALISVGIVVGSSRVFNPLHDRTGLSIIIFVFGIDVLIGISYVLSMVRQIKNRRIFKNTLIYQLVKICLSGSNFKTWALLLLLAYGAVNGFIFALMAVSRDALLSLFAVFLLLAFNIAVIYFTAGFLYSLSQVMEAAKEISTGNLDYTLDHGLIAAPFSDLARDIQSIQGGLKRAVAVAVQGERMKTDLITNVSHDLKTPLTSIVNYVDLLKREALPNGKAQDYLNILEEKSARLKQLIEDLIEASKAASGNVTVKAEKINLHELILQACGEYEEKIKNAKLELHINAGAKDIFILADGKHVWRILENLLSNILKYALPGSRVYFNLTKSDKYGLLAIKNISASPLNISPEQLMERFVRGDTARTTEGSGLGLSIARSLTNIQGGRFKIQIDGDLFKVMLELPLSDEILE